MKFEITNRILVVTADNVKIEEDIEDVAYSKDENGKIVVTGRDIKTDTIEMFERLLMDLIRYRRESYDSSELVKILLEKLPKDKLIEMYEHSKREAELYGIEDRIKKVSRPNFRQYLRDKINVKVRVTPELSEELQKICFEEGVFWYPHKENKVMHTDKPYIFITNYARGYVIAWTDDSVHFTTRTDTKEYNPETDPLVDHTTKKVEYVRYVNGACFPKITVGKVYKVVREVANECYIIKNDNDLDDMYLKKHFEPVETTTTAMETLKTEFQKGNIKISCDWSEPQPIKFEDPVPEYVFTVTKYGIFRFAVSRYHCEKTKAKDGTITNKEKRFAFEGDNDGSNGEVTIDIKDCYRTLEDAVMVAKKLWEVEQ